MDFSQLDRRRTIIGGVAGVLLLVSILFLPWFSLTDTPERVEQRTRGCAETDEYSCTGFETFPILRWLLLASTFAPLILAWVIVRQHKLSWAPGELTMVVGFVAMVLIAYNGLIDRPRRTRDSSSGSASTMATGSRCCARSTIAAVAFMRSLAGQTRERKAPGTV